MLYLLIICKVQLRDQKFLYLLKGFVGNDHEIEFHDIEIGIFHEFKSFAKLIMRSKLGFCKNDHEIEMALGALRGLG